MRGRRTLYNRSLPTALQAVFYLLQVWYEGISSHRHCLLFCCSLPRGTDFDDDEFDLHTHFIYRQLCQYKRFLMLVGETIDSPTSRTTPSVRVSTLSSSADHMRAETGDCSPRIFRMSWGEALCLCRVCSYHRRLAAARTSNINDVPDGATTLYRTDEETVVEGPMFTTEFINICSSRGSSGDISRCSGEIEV